MSGVWLDRQIACGERRDSREEIGYGVPGTLARRGSRGMPKRNAPTSWRICGIAATFLLGCSLAIWIYRGIRWDPRFSTQNLRGLTPEQVVDHLGPPDVDPRKYNSNPWKPADEVAGEPLKFFYERGWLGQEYMVVFKQDHVDSVARAVK
jgi:hypothetical protein